MSGLLEREIGFLDALRDAGITVSLAEVLDATRAMGAIDLMDRESLRHGFAACVLKRPAHRTTFDTLFDLWFPAAIGESAASSYDEAGELIDGDGEPPDPSVLRDLLRQLLLDGDQDNLRRFAREVVSTLGRADAQPGRQSWFSYRVLRSLSPETLMASLLEALLKGQDRGGLAELFSARGLTVGPLAEHGLRPAG